jgi:hypothetical protein
MNILSSEPSRISQCMSEDHLNGERGDEKESLVATDDSICDVVVTMKRSLSVFTQRQSDLENHNRICDIRFSQWRL